MQVSFIVLAFFKYDCFYCKVMVSVKAGCLVPAILFVSVVHPICPLLMADDRHYVWHGFYASTMLLVLFYLFRAALAPVHLLTWPRSAAVSSGPLGGFNAGRSVPSCCPGAVQQGILRSIKRDIYGQMAAKDLNKQV